MKLVAENAVGVDDTIANETVRIRHKDVEDILRKTCYANRPRVDVPAQDIVIADIALFPTLGDVSRAATSVAKATPMDRPVKVAISVSTPVLYDERFDRCLLRRVGAHSSLFRYVEVGR